MSHLHEFVRTRHGSLAFTRFGEGPPLVLLPANGHDARDFDAVRFAFSRHFETFAFDWPAMGASEPLASPDGASVFSFAEMLEDTVDALSLLPCVLVGHSVGGFASVRLAARNPSKVRALVLVDSGGFVPAGAFARAACRVKGMPFVTRLSEG